MRASPRFHGGSILCWGPRVVSRLCTTMTIMQTPLYASATSALTVYGREESMRWSVND